jgi:hypothetical protein
MAPHRRARFLLTGTGGQLPLDGLVDPKPLSGPPVPPTEAPSQTSSDALLNARRARWLEERARYEATHPRSRPAEKPAPE